jgi:hypothetical protein
MNRRRFLATLLAAPVAAAYLPKMVGAAPLVYRPMIGGAYTGVSLDELNAVTLRQIMPGVEDQFFVSNPLLAYLRKGSSPSPSDGSLHALAVAADAEDDPDEYEDDDY